jgi:hypothetical protein
MKKTNRPFLNNEPANCKGVFKLISHRPIFAFMQTRNTPITVWHSQPFELQVLDEGMRWALVWYRNPCEHPRTFSILNKLFFVRSGQSFNAIGNEDCFSIRVWQFRWWLDLPQSKRIRLAVHKISERHMPTVNITAPLPAVVSGIARELEQETLLTKATPQIALHIQPKTILSVASCNLRLNITEKEPTFSAFENEPNLKSFQDAL